ncbi:uncharacterized protein LOC120005297 [Tripterygium wilfordii]|uniref:uncharacterized protein LOC120005297 n=1 Tax=Tripterygium wilfordii TaxID=458696 RepID=UPI0018F848B1|nr:uncharacterized protein LOC120005297 [Tripterygium wilfordii]
MAIKKQFLAFFSTAVIFLLLSFTTRTEARAGLLSPGIVTNEHLLEEPGTAQHLLQAPEIATAGTTQHLLEAPEITTAGTTHHLLETPEITTAGTTHHLLEAPEITTAGTTHHLLEAPGITTAGTTQHLLEATEITTAWFQHLPETPVIEPGNGQ